MTVLMNEYEFTATTPERLDVFLAKQITDHSRSFVQKLVLDGHVNVNQKIQKSNYKLCNGDHIEVVVPEPQAISIQAEDLPLDILYEDQHIIVINKARGMIVHPASGIYSGTLVNALLAHCQDLSGINGEIRPGIVHRLDKDTSGVMIAAKDDLSHTSLAEQIKSKTAHRQYLAIVKGNIKEESGIIHGDIGRDPKDRKKMAIVAENGKPASTQFKVLERYGDYTLVECTLMTGRTHQIRVHMTHIGHPLIGDPKYGTTKSPFKINGQALHSENLSLIHPITKEKLFFSAPIPDDMAKILIKLRTRTKNK